MSWLQALLLGLVQGLTEFLPVSSSGHLMIVRELLGVDGEGFLDFTVTVHLATVLSTLVVFWKPICRLVAGLFKFKYNDETDYVFKIIVSMVPVALVGLLFKDKVEALFGDTLTTVGICLTVTAVLLVLSDFLPRLFSARIHGASGDLPVRPFTRTGREARLFSARIHGASGDLPVRPFIRTGREAQGASGDTLDAASAGQGTEAGCASDARNGISYWQAFVVGIGQALAVAPGLSRSGTTIATGLICGVRREVMAQFSFLMVLVPILGEQFLDLVKTASGEAVLGGGVSPVCLAAGFLAAFVSGLLACKVMIALVRKAKLSWFALYWTASCVSWTESRGTGPSPYTCLATSGISGTSTATWCRKDIQGSSPACPD